MYPMLSSPFDFLACLLAVLAFLIFLQHMMKYQNLPIYYNSGMQKFGHLSEIS